MYKTRNDFKEKNLERSKGKDNMNNFRNVISDKIAPGALAIMMLANAIMPAAVASAASKEEVVYVNTNANGKVEDIDVVNIFSLEHAGVIEDFGDYANVRNMTTTDKIKSNDGKVTVDVSKAGKIYYDGKLVSSQAPWTLTVKYYLNGDEKSASEIAGAEGKLKISLTVSKNAAYAGPDFFSNYALQGTLQLDTTKCENIVAEGATIANVGQNKQLTYIALPGEGLDVEITADVKDFEMDGFSINGIPLNLNIEVDDTELMNKVRDLKNAVVKLDDGTGELNSGIKMLSDGVIEVDKNLKKLDSFSTEIAEGSDAIMSALKQIQAALPDMNALATKIAALKTGATSVKTGIDDLATNASAAAAGYTYAGYVAKMKAAFVAYMVASHGISESNAAAMFDTWSATDDMGKFVMNYSNQYFNSTDAAAPGVNTALKGLATGISTLKTGYGTLYSGINELTNSISSLSTLKTAIDTITSKYAELNSGTSDYTEGLGKIVAGYQLLLNGVGSVSTGSNTLKNGTSEFRKETANLDTTVSSKIDELISNIKGNAHIGSFASTKNTDVKAVQFVMKTEKIEKPVEKVEKKEETSTKKSFWEKFLDLFKF
ncbi:hypothetical protein IJG78_03300 [Candidatus Saccharibacteria bacterium]|nr:hypothetical protein [Candidatus Saccharibacteria bacterium]